MEAKQDEKRRPHQLLRRKALIAVIACHRHGVRVAGRQHHGQAITAERCCRRRWQLVLRRLRRRNLRRRLQWRPLQPVLLRAVPLLLLLQLRRAPPVLLPLQRRRRELPQPVLHRRRRQLRWAERLQLRRRLTVRCCP